jgi:outer membrane protein assembly factor BamB
MNYPSPQAPSGQAAEPVVVCMGRALVAFDRATGTVLWNFVAEAAIQRLFRVESRVLCASGETVVCVELSSGRHIGTVNVGFVPDAGLVCGNDLILADGTSSGSEEPRVVCIASDGTVRWRATTSSEAPRAQGEGWGASPAGAAKAESVLRTYGADGTKRSEIRYARSGYRAGILFGGAIAQPDRS